MCARWPWRTLTLMGGVSCWSALRTMTSECSRAMNCTQGDKFSYALANGIVGVYSGQERFWRIKSKHQPICMAGFDMNEDGVPEVITGWSSGKVDVRSSQTGNVIYKDTFSSTVAGIVQADYRLDGKEELICCSVEGEVRGYLPASMGMVSQQHSLSLGPESKALQELTKRRQNLTMELKNFEINEKVASSKDPEGEVGVSGPMGVIPASTMLKTKFGVIIPDGETQGNASLLVLHPGTSAKSASQH